MLPEEFSARSSTIASSGDHWLHIVPVYDYVVIIGWSEGISRLLFGVETFDWGLM